MGITVLTVKILTVQFLEMERMKQENPWLISLRTERDSLTAELQGLHSHLAGEGENRMLLQTQVLFTVLTEKCLNIAQVWRRSWRRHRLSQSPWRLRGKSPFRNLRQTAPASGKRREKCRSEAGKAQSICQILIRVELWFISPGPFSFWPTSSPFIHLVVCRPLNKHVNNTPPSPSL